MASSALISSQSFAAAEGGGGGVISPVGIRGGGGGGLMVSSSSSSSSVSSSLSTFPINEECTSITLTSSGNIIIAGFNDGTIRLFDRTGTFLTAATTPSSSSSSSSSSSPSWSVLETSTTMTSDDEQEFDEGMNSTSRTNDDEDGDDATSNDDSKSTAGTRKQTTKKSATFVEVNSSYHQRYGAVAGQIYAKGVHTTLRLDCVLSEDDQYCFASVLRGNMECLAIHIGPLEDYLLQSQQEQQHQSQSQMSPSTDAITDTSVVLPKVNLLDLVHVYRYSDAKLRGLGACTRLSTTTTTTTNSNNNNQQYLLLTGKSIKNIHIWSFQPPPLISDSSIPPHLPNEPQPIWQCLYDCPTNGNTIQWLAFRRAIVDDHDTNDDATKSYKLQAISKSLHQKLRVWDISHEEEGHVQPSVPPKNQREESHDSTVSTVSTVSSTISSLRRNRPPYKDILNTESALGIAGNWIVCGGELFDNQISIVSLVDTSSTSVYNHTELALPPSSTTSSLLTPATTTTANTDQRRQQRGDMKCVVAVSGVQNHAVLELSDGNVAEYRVITDDDQPKRTKPSTSTGITMIHTIEKLPDSTSTRQLSVRNIMDPLTKTTDVVAVTATYQPVGRGQGTITVQTLHQQSVPAETPFTVTKSCPKEKENVTPTPFRSNIKFASIAKSTSELPVHQNKINVVTTVKKHANQVRLSGHQHNGLQNDGPSVLVTAIKKTQKMSRKQKKCDDDDGSVASTPYRIDTAMSIPKKQRTKVSSGTMISTKPSVELRPSGENALLASFSTPFPKNITPSNNISGRSDSTAYVNKGDNYLPAMYETVPSTSSAIKQGTTTPTWIGTKSNSAKSGTDINDSIGIDDEPSPPIPRKRSALTSLGMQHRRVSLSLIKAPSIENPDISSHLDVVCHDHTSKQLQNVTTNVANKIPPSCTPTSSSSKSVIDSPMAIIPGVSTKGKYQFTTTVSVTSTKQTAPTTSKETLPTTTMSEYITSLCNEKLLELESLQVQVEVPCHSTVLVHSRNNDTNPYDKKHRVMMAHHYACHVQMRQRIIDAARATIYSIMDAPIPSSIDKARGFFYSALLSYQELTNEMIQLQRVEAYSLLALKRQQSSIPVNHRFDMCSIEIDDAPNFAFPSIFEDVMAFIPVIG